MTTYLLIFYHGLAVAMLPSPPRKTFSLSRRQSATARDNLFINFLSWACGSDATFSLLERHLIFLVGRVPQPVTTFINQGFCLTHSSQYCLSKQNITLVRVAIV